MAMDNDAFQKLVREGSKSSKEIARDAVEQEFKRRKRKRRGGGESSSDDESDSRQQQQQHRKKKDGSEASRRSIQQTVSKKKEIELDSRYRDRAKERREGKTTAADQQDVDQIIDDILESAERQEDSNEFLDDDHVPVIKGLDLSLARSIKEKTGKDKVKAITDLSEILKSKDDGDKLISSAVEPKSGLGRDMLDYLRTTFLQKESSNISLSITPAGQAVQRSSLTFSLQANPGDFVHAWDVPREQTFANRNSEAYTKASPLNSAILLKIEKALAKKRAPSQHAAATSKAVEDKMAEEESDDDIFDNVGDEYVLAVEDEDEPEAEGSEKAVLPAKKESGSFFEGGSSSVAVAMTSEQGREEDDSAEPKGDVDDKKETIEPMKSKRLVGFASSAAYDEGYGDEMDMDFDGRLEDEDGGDEAGKKKKKKKQDETTEAAKEYGSARRLGLR